MRLSLQSWHTSSLPESSSSLSLHFTCYPGFLSQTVCLANPVFHLVSTSVSFHLSTFLEDLHDLFLWHKLQPLSCFSPPKETSSCFCSSIDTTICLLVEPLSGIFFFFHSQLYQDLYTIYSSCVVLGTSVFEHLCLNLKGTCACKLICFYKPNYWSLERYYFFLQTWSLFKAEGFLLI